MDDRDTTVERPPAEGLTTEAEPAGIDPQVVAGYAVGVGAVFVATLGVYWNYWRPLTHDAVWVAGSFAIGAALGALWALLRRGRV